MQINNHWAITFSFCLMPCVTSAPLLHSHTSTLTRSRMSHGLCKNNPSGVRLRTRALTEAKDDLLFCPGLLRRWLYNGKKSSSSESSARFPWRDSCPLYWPWRKAAKTLAICQSFPTALARKRSLREESSGHLRQKNRLVICKLGMGRPSAVTTPS